MAVTEPVRFRSAWISNLAGFIILAYAALRKLTFLYGYPSYTTAIWLLSALLILYTSRFFVFRRFPSLRRPYFFLQLCLIQALGLLRPYEDTWIILYIFLILQIQHEEPPREFAIWGGVCILLMTLTQIWQFGWLAGLGFSLAIIAAGLIMLSFDRLLSQAEAAQAESQRILGELQQAHHKLAAYALQAEELAAAHERERLTRELHDSVSQMIFSINLTAEATRMLLQKDPPRVPEQLELLQELTGQALSRMRQLISQWRPG